jgi:hypothetical protein
MKWRDDRFIAYRPSSRPWQLMSFHEVRMDSPAVPLIPKRRFFHEVPVLEKALGTARGQRLLGADGTRVGGSDASHE